MTTKSEDSSLWQDQEQMQKVLKQKTQLENKHNQLSNVFSQADNLKDLFELAANEHDQELLSQIKAELDDLTPIAKQLEIEALFTGEADHNNCFVEINAGAGGTESHDWAMMLMRMYLRFFEKMNFEAEVISCLDGEEAGIKSATIKIIAPSSYGWLKSESGVHRLVRISPFNAQGKRQTSFASVWVYPEVSDNINITIEDKDLRVDTYRASGAGGQHVNKTDSAIRITHLPTNIVAQCQSDRSQHRNRAAAMKMLQSRLYEQELRTRQEKVDASNSAKTDIGWGHQIRS
ncbi:MAG: peptide chain release factor 2, partial [Pseudomonadota bacterium]